MTDKELYSGTLIKYEREVTSAYDKVPRTANDLPPKLYKFYAYLLGLRYDLSYQEELRGGKLTTLDWISANYVQELTLDNKVKRISKRTVFNYLDELELRGFIKRSTEVNTVNKRANSLMTLTVMVKDTEAQEQQFAMSTFVEQEFLQAPPDTVAEFGADDFGAENMVSAIQEEKAPDDIVACGMIDTDTFYQEDRATMTELQFNSTQAIDYITDKLGGEIPYQALGFVYNEVASLMGGADTVSSLLVDNFVLELQEELAREQEARQEAKAESL